MPTAIALILWVSPAWALNLTVEVEGVSGDLEKNVRALLTVLHEDSATMSASRLQRLHLQAKPEIEQALRPFGYYTPHIDSALTPREDGWLARYRIDPGAPVRVATVDLH
ncbi:MAG: POTRA domain-containing protein, partial [Candidatus Macondimonas sp.]